jgi:hypothetical protein
MAQKIYRISSFPKFESKTAKETHVFKGTLEDLLYKFGAKDSNPMVGYVFKRVQYIYKFFLWNGSNWVEVLDPRPISLSKLSEVLGE